MVKKKTKTAPKTSKKAPKPKKAPTKMQSLKTAKSTLKKAPALKPLKTVEKAVKPIKEEKKKAALPLNQILKTFTDSWNPKTDTFWNGLQQMFAIYDIPGKNDAEKDQFKAQAIDKLLQALRKEPLHASIEEQLLQRYPRDRVARINAIFSMKPKTAFRLNLLKSDLRYFGESLAAKELKLKRSSISPWAFYAPEAEEVLAHAVFERGVCELHDEANQLAAVILNARPGMRILDMCAKNGDNTIAIASIMKNKGSLFSFDNSPEQLKAIKKRVDAAGFENVRLVSSGQIGELKGLDAVLIDAPSSSIGQIAHHPDIKLTFKKDDLARLQKLQAALIREAARKLKLGGRFIYTTTSLNRAENEEQIEHFLRSSHNSYRLVPASQYLKEYVVSYLKNFFSFEWSEKDLSSFLEFDPYFVLSPEIHGTSGMFAAVVERVRISN